MISARCCMWGALTSVLALSVFTSTLDRHAYRPAIVRQAGLGDPAPSGASLYQLGSVWTTDRGDQVHFGELKGYTRVLALMFTHCPKLCPTLVRDLKAMDAAMPAQTRSSTRYVLVTIDPEHDTPSALREFRTRMQLDPKRWLLLCGSSHDTQQLAAVLGFNYGKGDGRNYTHSNLVTILDREGAIVHQEIGLGNDASRAAAVLESARMR